jgi:acetyltransferase
MPHPLDSFFAPDSIALIGASRDQEKIPGRLLSMLRKNGYPGRIFPINPNYGDIDGLKCYPSIVEVGQPIDLAIHIPARALVARAMRRCGVKTPSSSLDLPRRRDSAPCRTPSWRWRKTECGSPVPMRRISASPARRRHLRSTVDGKPNEQPLVASKRRIGIAQSGGIGLRSITAPRRGVAPSYVISAGNESDLGAGEFQLPVGSSTDVILLFIEGIRDVDSSWSPHDARGA